uniref:DUF4283 domain-containing protein n=1 Tax=Setaria viridis TaxID=4556 RepID=A0A4V6DAA5_SETVI|nr:hypothetical protein SEVIR_3G354600v2 [Setaria viridis]
MAKKDSKAVVISLEGGKLTKEEVQRQLERIFPGKWVWELKEHEEDTFLTKFPSKIELQRAIAFGGADIRGADVPMGSIIKFEMWHEKETGFLLPKVWVIVFGIRKDLRELLDLWAVGSMLGSTQTVDMETTRKSDFGCIFVAVLNPSLIPARLDVVIGDHYFQLEFEVEKAGMDENGKETIFEWNGDGDGEEEVEEEEEELRDGEKGKKAEAILDISTEVIGEIADRIMEEEEEGQLNETMDGVVSNQGEDKEMEQAARIPEATLSQVHCSPRLQRSNDENTLVKAKQIGVNFGVSEKNRCDNVQQLFRSELGKEKVEQDAVEQPWVIS